MSILVRSAEYWVSIKPNKAPVAESSTLRMAQGATLVGTLNATDDYDGAEQLTFEIATPPSFGSATLLRKNKFSYTPEPEFSGVDSFTFKVCACTAVPSSAAEHAARSSSRQRDQRRRSRNK